MGPGPGLNEIGQVQESFCGNLGEQELDSMKRIVEIGTYRAGDSRLEVVDLTALEATVNENTAVFVGSTTVTSRIKGQDVSDSYQISRAYVKRQAQWRMVASQSARLAEPEARVANHLRRAAA